MTSHWWNGEVRMPGAAWDELMTTDVGRGLVAPKERAYQGSRYEKGTASLHGCRPVDPVDAVPLFAWLARKWPQVHGTVTVLESGASRSCTLVLGEGKATYRGRPIRLRMLKADEEVPGRLMPDGARWSSTRIDP